MKQGDKISGKDGKRRERRGWMERAEERFGEKCNHTIIL